MTFWRDWFSRGQTRRLHEIAERPHPTPEDRKWLTEASEGDPSIASTYASLRRWHELARQVPAAPAPGDFTDRVLRRARLEASERPRRTGPRWAIAGLAAAVGVAAFVVGVEMRPGPRDIARSGSSGWWTEAAPDLVIHARDIGAVQARTAFEQAVTAQGGRVERLETAVVARLARAALPVVLRTLAQRGELETTRPSTETDLPETVTLRLELGPPSAE